ncbi:hypothetical protein GCM10011579_036510 [Streptomyces albiflavescens]|uniref:DUF397 domain-containing protein n=1 Tax=Streptomyces albiflavescens TaxID=1623582 RepID=A0A918D478_9ACTN|nr:DUF397 domain-containing protein [Streptomyces albiflavescens]GGN65738.1 hypothetical protein GCM10011579_036510 [Streptomyces albiflavescens]
MTEWQKSSFSGGADGNECVELAHGNGTLLLRESDQPARILPLSRDGLAALLQQIRADRT